MGGGARQVLSTSTRRLSSSCTAILSSRHDGADLSGLLVRAADDGLLEVLVPLLLGARVPMIIHRAGLAAIARPEDEAEDHDSADDGTSTTIQFQLMQKKRRASKGGKPPGRGSQIMIPR